MNNLSIYHSKIIIVGEAIDLLIIVVALTLRGNNIYFLNPDLAE